MRLRLDDESYQAGYQDGLCGGRSKSHDELLLAEFDGWSYLSGYIEGEAKRITGSEPEK